MDDTTQPIEFDWNRYDIKFDRVYLTIKLNILLEANQLFVSLGRVLWIYIRFSFSFHEQLARVWQLDNGASLSEKIREMPWKCILTEYKSK